MQTKKQKFYKNIKLTGNFMTTCLSVYPLVFFVIAVLVIFGTFNDLWLSYFNGNKVLLTIINAMTIISGSILRIPFGALANRDGGRLSTLIILGAVVTGFLMITVLLFSVDAGADPGSMQKYYPVFVIGAFLVGFGGNYFAVGPSQITFWSKRSKYISVLIALFVVAAISGNAFISLIFGGVINGIAHLAPKYIFLIFLCIYILFLIYESIAPITPPFFKLLRNNIPYEESKRFAESEGYKFFVPKKRNVLRELAAVWKNPKLVTLIVFSLFIFGGFFVVLGWTTLVLGARFNLQGITRYGIVFSILMFGAAVTFGMSFLTKKERMPYIFAFDLTMATIGTLFIAIGGTSEWAFLLGTYLLLAFTLSCLPVLMRWAGMISPNLAASSVGWITGLGGACGGVIVIIGSVFTEKYNSAASYDYLYWILFGLAVIAAVLFAVLFGPEVIAHIKHHKNQTSNQMAIKK